MNKNLSTAHFKCLGTNLDESISIQCQKLDEGDKSTNA